MNTYSYWINFLPWVAAIVGACVGALRDLLARRIPNGLVLVMLIVGLGLASSRALIEGSIYPLLRSLTGGLIVGLVPLILWRVRLMGAGDVKLCTVLGTLVGARYGLMCVSGALTLGLMGVILEAAFYGSAPWRAASASVPRVDQLANGSGLLRRACGLFQPSVARSMPFAPALVVSISCVAALQWVTGWRV